MKIIYCVQHVINYDDRLNRKAIGQFSSFDGAVTAISQLRSMPGFRDSRGRFRIFACELGHDYAPDGCDAAARVILTPLTETSALKRPEQDQRLYPLYNKDIRNAEEFDDAFTLIGFYESESDALKAADRVRDHFCSLNREFEVGRCWVDRVSWASGFGPA